MENILKGKKPIDIPQSGLVGDFKDIDTAFKVALKSLLNSRSLNRSEVWKIININFWENLSTYDFSNLDLKNHLAILPIAAIEQHGPHLPVSVDSKIIDGLINKISKKLTKDNKLLFYN